MHQAGTHKHSASTAKVANVDRIAWRRVFARDSALVLVCVLLGLLLRLDFMRATGFTIDGDEAIVGLMGRDILLGRGVPVFYYGQHYMGSLEAIMASASFAMFGVSPFSLQLVPLVWSLGLIVIGYLITRELAGRRAGLIAAALIAIPAPALLVWSSKARGGFIEVVVIGALALWIMVRWLRHHPERLLYPCALGFLLGVGWWVNNQIIYFMLPIAIFSLLHGLSGSMRLVAREESHGSTLNLWRGFGRIASAGIVSFFIGSAPYWWYNIRFGFPSAGMFTLASWEQFWGHVEGLSTTALPSIVGAQRFWQRLPVFPLSRYVALCLYVVPIIVLFVVRWRQSFELARGRIDRVRPLELLLLFCLSCCLVFAVSSFGWLVQAPRYLLPLYIGLYPLIAVCCDWLWSRWRWLGITYLVALLSFQFAASYVGGRGISGEPVVFGGQRVARDHTELIQQLDQLGISRVRTNYWIGYRLAFETEERITFTLLGEPTQARIPRYEETDPETRALLPLVLVQSEVVVVKPALKRFGYQFREARAGEYSVLYDLRSEFPPSEQIDLGTIVSEARASSGALPRQAIDGSVDTRWGSAAPQTPGQTFELEFATPRVIDGLRYSYGAWFNDRPVELKVEIEDQAGARTVVLSQREWPGAMHLSVREPGFTLRFAPTVARRVILTQLGRHPILDWSIAEIALLSQSQWGAENDR
ncbi:MAG: glycosyltransferase family 39 protein [Pseudomonadota bacterium]|jgi:hypothetical protein